MEVEDRAHEGTLPDEMRGEGEKIGERQRRSHKRRIITLVIVSIINVALLVLLWSQLLVPAQNQSDSSSSGMSSMQSKSPLDGRPAPDFRLAQLSSGSVPKVHLASLKGKPVVINFWASWCDPCKREAPLLQSTWQRVQKQGVVLLGIDYQDTQSDGQSFLQKYGITYTNVVDPNSSVAINYGVTGVPETFFINSHGVVVRRVMGELTEQMLQSNIKQLS